MTQKGLLVTLVLLALNGAVEPIGDRTCKEFSLPEDTAKAKAFVKELTDQTRPGRPVTVSTTWRTSAAAAAGGGMETDEGVRAALVLMKQLQGKMEQMETGLETKLEKLEKNLHNQLETGLNRKMEQLETGLEKKLEEMQKKTESHVADLQKSIKETDAWRRCSAAGSGMTFTPWGCFKHFDITEKWAAAGAHCASLGLELASLEGVPTKGELIQLGTDLGLLSGYYYWLDLTAEATSGGREWRWGPPRGSPRGAPLDRGSPLWRGGGPPRNISGWDKGLFQDGYGLEDYNGESEFYFLCGVPQ